MIDTRDYKRRKMFTLVEQWKHSHLSQKDFLSQHKLSRHSFKYWITQYNKETQGHKPESKFIPVEVNHQTNEVKPTSEVIEIIYPNGVRLVVNTKDDLSRIIPLILLQ